MFIAVSRGKTKIKWYVKIRKHNQYHLLPHGTGVPLVRAADDTCHERKQTIHAAETTA